MKTLKLTILFLLLPLVFFAQSLTGLWTGTISNDSTTVRKDQSFEIVLTQYREKVYGYSRSTFIVNDTLFYIVKRIKGTIEGNVCEVKDDDIISHNFRGRLDKGVKMISTFRFDQQDSVWRLDGEWKTNQTKKYYSLSGKMDLKAEKDLDKSKIIPHLEELKLTDDIAFYKESKKIPEPVAVTKSPVKDNKQDRVVKEEKPIVALTKETKKEEIAKAPSKSEPVAEIKKTPKETALKEEKTTVISTNEMKKEDIAKSSPVVPIKEQVKPGPVVETKQPATVAVTDIKKEEENSIAKPVEQKKEVANGPATIEKRGPKTSTVTISNKEKDQPISLINAPELKPVAIPAAALIAERKTVAPQIVNYKSDSLELSLYDNGEVDGDTVSVLLNGELILARQGLKASAIKKTIYVPAGTNDSMILVLYAENLGKYPPNTGLLIVHDGEDVYQIRFTADLKQNAAVIFKRKRD